MRVVTPFDDLELPGNVEAVLYTGPPSEPSGHEDAEFYVAPYMKSPAETLSFLDQMPKLQTVQLLTAGYEGVIDHLPDGVTLCNARGVHDASTAELAVTLTLASLRGIPEFVRAQQDGQWAFQLRPALADKTVLILGYGSIGQAVERRLAGFEVDVVRVARSAREGVHPMTELPDLLPTADVIVVLVPLTEESNGMIDAGFLARMKDGAVLVNVARGKVVQTDALLAELETGRILAALDVTDPEPLPSHHPLWQAPGCLISPHVGGPTSAFFPRAKRLVTEQVRRFVAGEPLEHVVRPGR
ncbi:MAG: dihydrofolate reductase [Streptosporangiales bacterium]|nr:dihydrofolate reductase [Streptosporangiales bacterium]